MTCEQTCTVAWSHGTSLPFIQTLSVFAKGISSPRGGVEERTARSIKQVPAGRTGQNDADGTAMGCGKPPHRGLRGGNGKEAGGARGRGALAGRAFRDNLHACSFGSIGRSALQTGARPSIGPRRLHQEQRGPRTHAPPR